MAEIDDLPTPRVKAAKKATYLSQRKWPLATPAFASPTPAPRPSHSSRFQWSPKESLRQIRRPTFVECPQLSEANTDEDEFSISTRHSRSQAYQTASIGKLSDIHDYDHDGRSFGDNWLDELDEQPTFDLCSVMHADPRNMTLGSEVSRHSDLSWCGDENKLYRMPEGKKQLDVASEWFRQRCAPMGRISNDGNSDASDAADFGMIYYEAEQSPRKKQGQGRPRMAALFGFAEP